MTTFPTPARMQTFPITARMAIVATARFAIVAVVARIVNLVVVAKIEIFDAVTRKLPSSRKNSLLMVAEIAFSPRGHDHNFRGMAFDAVMF